MSAMLVHLVHDYAKQHIYYLFMMINILANLEAKFHVAEWTGACISR